MKAEDQRIAIAEVCGWKMTCHCGDYMKGHSAEHIGVPVIESDMPDYPNDLNAMHKAEKLIAPTTLEKESCCGKWTDYGRILCEILDYSEHERIWFGWIVYRATASQRAEAFLKTIGKWKEI